MLGLVQRLVDFTDKRLLRFAWPPGSDANADRQRRLMIDQDGADKLWHFTGLVDATMPYCYSFTMAEDSDEEFQTEHLKISDRKK